MVDLKKKLIKKQVEIESEISEIREKLENIKNRKLSLKDNKREMFKTALQEIPEYKNRLQSLKEQYKLLAEILEDLNAS